MTAVETLDQLTTTNVAEEVGCKYRSAYYRLNKLAEEGELRKENGRK